MRAYFFSNQYLNGIHTGIQAGHAMCELWLKYSQPDADKKKVKMLKDFATNHKTFIVLNGGDHASLETLIRLLEDAKNPYPFELFREPGLNNAITSVCVVLPERMYDLNAMQYNLSTSSEIDTSMREQNIPKFTAFEKKFLAFKSNCNLAK